MAKPQVMLDSGAYTMWKKGIKIDIDKYTQYVREHGNEYKAGCLSLDAIGTGKDILIEKTKQTAGKEIITTAQQSYRNWKYLKEQGAETIPIFHLGEDEIWLKKYLAQTDYIALGAIANLTTNLRRLGLDKIWRTYFMNNKGQPIVRIHGLGITTLEFFRLYPWYSVDSFTPVISAVWGSVLLPKERNGKLDYLEMEMCHISDQSKASPGNASSFLNYGKRLQERYRELFKENGFELGKIHYQKKDLTRKDKRKVIEVSPIEPLFDLAEASDNTDGRTLANHWEERMRWNLTYWTKLQALFPDVFMRMGVSTTTHLSVFGLVKPKLDILISYAYLSDEIYKAIKNYIR